MSRYIDADVLCEEFTKFVRKANNHDYEPTPTWNNAISIFHSMPTVDEVEVVYCEDCKHKEHCSQNIAMFGKGYDMYEAIHYCSYGERKDET